MYQRFKIFNTMLHEIKHSIINSQKENEINDIATYDMFKEKIVRKYDADFYETNYTIFKEEIIARLSGTDMLAKFVEAFLPEYLDQIQDEIIQKLEQEKQLLKKQNNNRTMNFLKNITVRFNKAFDTLVRYNPSILQKNLIFNLEYYKDGTPKTYEDIWLSRTEENKDLIDRILRMRYPGEIPPSQKQNHTK